MSVLEHPLVEELVVGGHPPLPRVNLLPPEIIERRRFRRVQCGLGATVLATVGAMVLLYAGAVGSVSSAEDELREVTAAGQALEAEKAQYADATAVYARADAAQALLTQAMGQEVRYSTRLSALALSVPDRVWLKNVSFNQTPAAPAVGDTTAGIGTVSFTGVGLTHDDVATWLDTLAAEKGYAKPYLTSSTDSLVGGRVTADFVSTVVLTPDALSRRYAVPAGG